MFHTLMVGVIVNSMYLTLTDLQIYTDKNETKCKFWAFSDNIGLSALRNLNVIFLYLLHTEVQVFFL